ncbi:ImuA family protein [Ketogulonicigenium vulgare]|uniref:Protein ImuA n=1 Tax=Ketogulonicigenium vulgare (strain WSH-001) TaxID=759362 RepID=F9Y784_KETVW|nr:hypothetical protein [Ketogulonicigenium vulgare]ADO41610.1 conserved hypothetical protein [Ketogulonicigenium vulgare Y25]AEM39851.1 hypothetical protein KVU_0012 [Ketogulonicigenium vulgare WSH-001]ALJ80066.1 hypothetical protein KVH_02075 [Ketogulonicigenium vulgare]ANW32944.1 hypothetical protein KvSKV_02075 [Ketogulonicigenium vulgare]AOZ53540.1 lipoprotein [Ketogulonicigenium vulgare]
MTLTAFPLRPGRVHEVAGPAAAAFALCCAAGAGDAGLIWVRPAWAGAALFPHGLADLIDPSRILIAQTASEVDTLTVAEESLRDGVLPLVIIEVTKPLSLRAGRRLQLAAGAGQATGLCLIPDGMGSNAAETRWHAAPVFGDQGDSTLMKWELNKNKSGTVGAWHVRWNRQTHCVDMVSPLPFGSGAAGARG